MRGGDQLVLIETCVDKNAPSAKPDVGATRQFHDTSLGHTYYSATGQAERSEIEQILQARHPQQWPVLRRSLAASQKSFLAKGYCIVPTPSAGILAISVPLSPVVDDELIIMNCAVAQFHLQSDTLETQIAPRMLNLVRLLQTTTGRR
jgi:DNA-binding IclR family transcriptional regulator